ncbi:hypothetical protein D9M68_388890 [compost metagenome]
MEVGHQHVDVREGEARRDEDARVARGLAAFCPRLERAHGGRAHGNHAPAACLAFGNGALRGLGHFVALGVHRVLGDVLGLHRLEGAGAHVQRDVGALHAARFEFGQQALVEMQRGRGRGHGAGHAREHGLVAALVVGRVGVRDVGRQRHVAAALHQRIRVFAGVALEAEAEQRAVFLGPAAQQRGAKAAHHLERGAHGRLLADLHVRDHLVALQHALDQQFELAAGRLLAEQARLDHARVVEDQQVARTKQRGQFLEDAVGRGIAGAVEQTGGGAFGGGVLCHQLGRQMEIEIGKREGAHGA